MVRSARASSGEPATYEDVLAAPEDMVAELIDGELFLQPRPAKPHALSASVLGADLLQRFHLGRGGPGGWWILDEPEIHFDRNVLVPDIAGWRRASTPHFDYEVAHYQEKPDWVCEVLSPSTANKDRLIKLDVYHRAHVEWAWLVDPIAQSIEVYQWAEKGWLRTHGVQGRETVRLDPFAEADLELDVIWPPDPPESP